MLILGALARQHAVSRHGRVRDSSLKKARRAMRIAPSRGSLCGADKWLRTWGTSHSVKSAARPPIRLIAGQPTSLSRSMMRVAASAASRTIAIANGSSREAYYAAKSLDHGCGRRIAL